MPSLALIMRLTLRSIIRDRMLHVLLGCSIFLFLIVPAFSLFSMRQVQELSITLSLSAISLILLVIATLLGATSIWRDVEKRYTSSVMGLPVSRSCYLLGKFAGNACFLAVGGIVLGIVAVVVISISASQYPSDTPIHWLNIGVAIFFDSLKFILLAAVATLFSSVSTSFSFPFFSTIAVYLCGSASQEVFDYISGDYGKTLSPWVLIGTKVVYYLIPNLSAFNMKVQAIYALPVSAVSLLLTLVYFIIYTAVVLCVSIWIFNRRELP